MPRSFVVPLFGALLLSAAGACLAGDERAVLAFELPPVDRAIRGDKPMCGDALDITRILADRSLYTALLGVDPVAKLELESNAALLHQSRSTAASRKASSFIARAIPSRAARPAAPSCRKARGSAGSPIPTGMQATARR